MGETAKVIPLPKKKGFGAALTATKTKKKSKAKKTTRSLVATDEIKEEIDRFVKSTKNMKVAKAEVENSKGIILDYINPLQDEDGEKGKFSTSYDVEGVKESIKFVSSNRYTINPDDEAKIAEILGNEFDELIVKSHVVKLKDEVFESEEMQDKLMELLGDDFGTFLETITTMKVAVDFNRDVYRAAGDKLDDLRVYCKPYSPSLR